MVNFAAALDSGAARQVAGPAAQVIDVNMDEGLLGDSKKAMSRFPQSASRAEPDIARVFRVMIRTVHKLPR